jgi:hypothetical protein
MNDGGRCSDEHDQGSDRDDKENMHLQQNTKLREVRAANSPERKCGFRAMGAVRSRYIGGISGFSS